MTEKIDAEKQKAQEAIEACENGNATPLQQKCVAKYFRDAWWHEGCNAERIAELEAGKRAPSVHFEKTQRMIREMILSHCAQFHSPNSKDYDADRCCARCGTQPYKWTFYLHKGLRYCHTCIKIVCPDASRERSY